MRLRRRRRRAGIANLREFRRRRRQALRDEWQGWTLGVALILLAAVGAWWFDGFTELVMAGFVGAAVAFVAIGWMIGFDVHNLPWMWGHLGERWTEEQLDELPPEWLVIHDVPRPRGNWDHVVLGPPGLFLIDSKFFHEPTNVDSDRLVTGTRRYSGGRFRGPAVALGDELERMVPPPRPWVNAVVAVWAEFGQRVREEEKVTYVAGSELLSWLTRQPPRLPESRRSEIASALKQLRTASGY